MKRVKDGLVFDRSTVRRSETDRGPLIAFDRSVRTTDRDGRLHVTTSNISKANICPYVGKEIPGAEEMGLDLAKVYQLLRDPAELEKAAATSNNIPLLSEHKPISASDPNEKLVAGSTGTDAIFEAPYLKNSLVIWRKTDIDAVESRDKCELSCAYHYVPDMTPGVWQGQPYDGVMRDIVFNHVALVEEGRAGNDVIVADSKQGLQMTASPKTLAKRAMTVGALVCYLKPRLATDAKLDIAKIFDGVTGKNFKAKRPVILKAIEDQSKGKLAQDATLQDMTSLLDSLEKLEDEEGEDESVSEEQHKAMEAAAEGHSDLGIPEKVGKEFAKKDEAKDASPMAWAKDFCTSRGMSEDDFSELESMAGKQARDDDMDDEDAMDAEPEPAIEPPKKKGAKDEPPPFKGMPKSGGKDKSAKDEDKKEMVTKGAMDAAIASAVEAADKSATARQKAIREAEREVRPWVGDLAIACDSAAEVHRAALKMLNVKDVDGLPDAALPHILRVQPLPGRKQQSVVAMDAAASKGFGEKFPEVTRIRHV